MIVHATRANFHLYGWATGPWKLRRKSRVTRLESINLSNALSSAWVGRRPMSNSEPRWGRVVSAIAILRQLPVVQLSQAKKQAAGVVSELATILELECASLHFEVLEE
jgi:hypothetical protein